MKVVFDSNIHVSALVFPGGVAEEAMRAATQGAFELAFSREILGEVLEVLSRKFSRDPEELARAALAISAIGEMVTATSHVDVLVDKADKLPQFLNRLRGISAGERRAPYRVKRAVPKKGMAKRL